MPTAASPRTPPASTNLFGPVDDPLVPIRLDLTLSGTRIQETFTWNALETTISPEAFAVGLAADLGLPSTDHEAIAEAIREQVAAFVPPEPRKPTAEESRQVVRLDLRIGRVVIRDQFEWDLSAPENCPESFAELLCADLGLSTAFVPAVAHAIREQLVDLAEFEDMRQGCATLGQNGDDVIRPPDAADAWEPVVECLSVEEQERLERKEKREARLMRRNRGKADLYGRMPARRRSAPDRRRSSGTLHSGSEDLLASDGEFGRYSDTKRRRHSGAAGLYC